MKPRILKGSPMQKAVCKNLKDESDLIRPSESPGEATIFMFLPNNPRKPYPFLLKEGEALRSLIDDEGEFSVSCHAAGFVMATEDDAAVGFD